MKEFVNVSKLFSVLAIVLAVSGAGAQSPADATPQPDAPDASQTQPQTEAAPPPRGQVLFERHSDTAPPADVTPEPTTPAQEPPPAGAPELTDADRTAATITAYDLLARITPASSALEMRARLTLRNDGKTPLSRIALQISSTLHWESATLVGAASPKLGLSQHLIDTDADHTGKASESVLTLPVSLAPGASVELDTLYSGTIAASGARLERIGASQAQALAADWDAIAPRATALRGFGDVLWYPVASRQVFLGDGAELFDAVGAARLREATASIRLRLAVEYRGDPPTAAYFCGRHQPLAALSDNADAPIASGSGVATAEFKAEALGFRTPSLFLVELPETLIAPLPSYTGPSTETAETSEAPAAPAANAPDAASSSATSSSTEPGVTTTAAGPAMLAVESDDEGALPALGLAAEQVAPTLQEWLGATPLSALTILDQPGQPFEDGPLLAAPAASLAAASSAPALVHSLTHAWVQTGQPWIDEGLAQFMALVWTERVQGRETALAQLGDLIQPLSIAEPAMEPAMAHSQAAPQGELVGQVLGQPLIAATSELYYRRKAAAVWWMLRGIVGDEPLQLALQAFRERVPAANATSEQEALAFEALLERSGRKNAQNPINLHWFFDDWILHDRGLPDLSIADVTPRELPAGKGHNTGWLVSVTVRNDGAAAAEVPVTIRAATYSTTSRLRIAGFASATARVLVEAAPSEVLVNDGSTPEVRASTHELAVTLHQQQSN